MQTDNELLKMIINKPERGLEQLMDKYAGLIYTIVSNKVSTVYEKQDIEECVSDIFLEFYNNIDKVDLVKGSIKAYLATIAKRRAIDMYRKGVSKPYISSLNQEEYSDLMDMNSNVNDAVDKAVIRESLIREVKSLGEPDSEIIIRKYYMGQRTRYIAKALKMKENTVDKRISRGLKKLRDILGGVI